MVGYSVWSRRRKSFPRVSFDSYILLIFAFHKEP